MAWSCGSIFGDGDWDWHWGRLRVDLRFLFGNGLKLVGEQVIVGSAAELVVHVCCLLFLFSQFEAEGQTRKGRRADFCIEVPV